MPLVLYDVRPRCPGCNRLLAERVTRPWVIMCSRCKRFCTGDESGVARTMALEEEE